MIKYKFFLIFHQKTILQRKLQKFNNIIKKQNVHNRLFNDSIKNEKMLNNLQLKHLEGEAKKCTFIPKIIHNFNLYQQKGKKNYETPLTRRNTESLKNSGNKRKIFQINNNIKISNGNKSETKNLKKLIENSILPIPSDFKLNFNKNKPKDLHMKNNNNLKNKKIKPKKTVENFKSSNIIKNQISKIILKNISNGNNYSDNDNKSISKSTREREKRNINLFKELNSHRLKNNIYYTTINNLFNDDMNISNILYNTNYNNYYNNMLKPKKKLVLKDFQTIQSSTTESQSKNSVLNINSNKKIINRNKFNIHSQSYGGNYINNIKDNINIDNNNISRNGQINSNEKIRQKKIFGLSRNISKNFSSYLFNNNSLINNKKKIPFGIKSIEIKKIKDNSLQKKTKLKTSRNDFLVIHNLFNEKEARNKNKNFNSIDFENNYNNEIENKCNYFMKENDNICTNSKEIKYNLSYMNKNNIENNNEINIELNSVQKNNNILLKSFELNQKSYFKNYSHINENNQKILNSNDKIKKDLLAELNKTESIKNDNLQISHFYFLYVNKNKKNINIKKIYKDKNINKNENNNKNFKKNNSGQMAQKIEKNNLHNFIYIKNEKRFINKKNINKINNKINKNNIIKNIENDNVYNIDIKKNNRFETEENINDNISVQSMSDSKIYEMTNNYMSTEELIDKNQINNILFNKK